MDMEFGAVLAAIAAVVLKVIFAIVLLLVGFMLIDKVSRKLVGALQKRGEVDRTILTSLSKAISVALKVLLIIVLVGYLGIDTSGLAALVASLGVTFGLAVNGAVANLAGGILLLVTRPFKVDDFIEVGGFMGTVKEIGLINTKILTMDNRIVYIPNGTVSSSSLINYNQEGLRRVDLVYSVSYSSDYTKAQQVIGEILAADPRILKDPAPTVRVVAQTLNGLDICCRPYVRPEHYWDVFFDLNEKVKTAFDANGIQIPFQQVEVTVSK